MADDKPIEMESIQRRLELTIHYLSLLIDFCSVNRYGEKSKTVQEARAYCRAQQKIEWELHKQKEDNNEDR